MRSALRDRSPGRAAVLLALLLLGARLAAGEEPAKPLVHPLFTPHAVLQRDQPIAIWGWAAPGAAVAVRLGERDARAVAGADGAWRVRLEPHAAGGPLVLTVRSDGRTVTADDLWFGDVWICAGQSNMQFSLHSANDGDREVARADDAKIRLFLVPDATALEPRRLVDARWRPCTRDTARDFSAVAYFFGRHLRRELDVPIGLIESSWGGTVAEAWTSEPALRTLPDFAAPLDALAQRRRERDAGAAYAASMERWYADNDAGTAASWQAPAFDDRAWKPIELPRAWPERDFDGVMWFRRAVDVPAAWAGRELILRLGPIDDRDTTFVDGRRVGAMDRYDAPREYRVPGAQVKGGRMLLAVRVLDTGGPGGIRGQATQMSLACAGAAEPPLSLAGGWRYAPGVDLRQAKTAPPRPPDDGDPNVVTVLSNAMIEPLVGFRIKGAIWYQGESNHARAYQYRSLLPALIGDWRARWNEGEFPFLIVQLANFTDPPARPGESDWAELREAQLMTARTVPGCGIAVTIDLGEARNVHPKNKQEVGRRLGLVAQRLAYGEDVPCTGPVFIGMKLNAGGGLRLSFSALGPLVARDAKLVGFAVAGADREWAWADAAIDGDDVVVSSSQVAQPVAVRYAWADNPAGCDLTDQSGLPASPFRTDDWPGVTIGAK